MAETSDRPSPNSERLSRQSTIKNERSIPRYETGESSTARDANMTEPAREASPVGRSPPKLETGSKRGGNNGGDLSGPGRTVSKGHKSRSSGGFLLHDAIPPEASTKDEVNTHRRRHSRRLLQSIRPKSSSKTQGKAQLSPPREGLGITRVSEPQTTTTPSSHGETITVKKTRQPADEPEAAPSSQDYKKPEQAPLDTESAQIVDMALRINQSRRISSQRPVSHQTPPKLAPLPDTTNVSSLRQHLLQQRKVSKAGSPRPERGMPRTASGLRSAFDSFDLTSQDGDYRYHVSRSTLGRVQKAKEYIELMAQYRRVLEYLPPIKSGGSLRPTTSASTNMMPTTAAPGGGTNRQYNPLQYIRNRKVRARERQTIDGEAQGFRDVVQVTGWVDEVAESCSSRGSVADTAQDLPVFRGPELHSQDPSNASTVSKPSTLLGRRRVDWIIEPADLLADAYWLEQGSNKLLLEDRHWNRLYPRTSNVSLRPPLLQPDDQPGALSRPVTREVNEDYGGERVSDTKLSKTETEGSHGSARDRSRLRIKGLHHRHNSSVHSHHDFFHLRRGSVSDVSDSDGDARALRARSGTITTTGKDILEKQMLEMIAMEERENASLGAGAEPLPRQQIRTPRREKRPSRPSSRFHSRQGSFADVSESEDKSGTRRPPRLHLDVPASPGRRSLEEATAPNSPEQPPSRGSYADLSPMPSRGTSPPRHRFSKVKHRISDRRKDRSTYIDDRIREVDVYADLQRWAASSAADQLEHEVSSPERHLSGSPPQKALSARNSQEGGRGHLRIPSMKLKGEEATGIRSMLKSPGARIDNVLRSTASKLGDIIWKKDSGAAETPMSEESPSEESEVEQRENRTGGPQRSQDERQSKSYLGQLPAFHTPERRSHDGRADAIDSLSEQRGSRRPSIQVGDARRPQLGLQTALTPDTHPPIRGGDTPESHVEGKLVKDSDALERPPHLLHKVPPSFISTHHYSSISQRPATLRSRSPDHAPVSRREIARLRALLLSSGIMATEISRRANQPRRLPIPNFSSPPVARLGVEDTSYEDDARAIPWATIANLAPSPTVLPASKTAPPAEMYPLAADLLGTSIQASSQKWHRAAETFAGETVPALHSEIDALRIRLAVDLSSMVRAASDDADDAGREVSETQRLKVKRVVDTMEKMLRRRRRRFRWVRRAGWLAVEWVLVGFMWYVWFVVMIFRIVWGAGRGAVRGVRWLLWLS